MVNTLVVKDENNILQIQYEDMIKYHGRSSIAGVALAFKSLELAFQKLLGEEIPDRKEITFFSALGPEGLGIIDGVEMVSRAKSDGRMVVNKELKGSYPGPVAPQGGNYYFEVGYRDKKIGLTLKEGLIPDEFIILARRSLDGTITEDEAKKLQNIKETLAQKIMNSKADDIYESAVL